MDSFLRKLGFQLTGGNYSMQLGGDEKREGRDMLLIRKVIPPITDEEKPFALPDGWVWCRYGDVMLDIEAGKSPTCYNYPAKLGEWGVLKISAISWNSFRENENKKLKPNIEPFSDKEVKYGDFIMTRANTKELRGFKSQVQLQ